MLCMNPNDHEVIVNTPKGDVWIYPYTRQATKGPADRVFTIEGDFPEELKSRVLAPVPPAPVEPPPEEEGKLEIVEIKEDDPTAKKEEEPDLVHDYPELERIPKELKTAPNTKDESLVATPKKRRKLVRRKSDDKSN